MKVITVKGKASKGLPDNFNLDFESMRFPYVDSEVAAIYLHDILHKIHSPSATLKECWRVLKPEGYLDIVVPEAPAQNAFDDLTAVHHFSTAALNSIIDSALWKTLNFETTPEIVDEGDKIIINKRREIHVKLQPVKEETV